MAGNATRASAGGSGAATGRIGRSLSRSAAVSSTGATVRAARWNVHSAARSVWPPTQCALTIHWPSSRRRASQRTVPGSMPWAPNRSSTASPKTTVWPSVVLRRALDRRASSAIRSRSASTGPAKRSTQSSPAP